MSRTQASLVVLPVLALLSWMALAFALFDSVSGAPAPVIVVGFYFLPIIYLTYVVGYGFFRLIRRVLSSSLCLSLCCGMLLLFAWRIPALTHGVNGSDRPRESHILVWTLMLAVPGVGGLVGSLPDRWFRRCRLDSAADMP
jgi:hypothetical protein